MNSNQSLVEKFYNAFSKLDYHTMNDCYSDYPIFNDPAFGILQGEEVRMMWKMLCQNAKDFSLSYSNIQVLDEEYITCNWVATYTFSRTGRKVVNNIKAHMRIQDGKITEHSDLFDLWKWSSQAMGLPGRLLGWSGFMKNKIQAGAKDSLRKFMERNSNG